ncbi:histidinol phosphate phosphatase [bacterium]|nr:histidinol phosphate phosphatase [bacterium]
MPSMLNELAAFAHTLADAADEIARHYFAAGAASHYKSDKTPVTLADESIEQRLREMISKTYPSHGIWGEEQGKTAIDADYVWVIDPIDGTRSFMAGKPQFMTLIALCHKGKPVIGTASQAILKERYMGVQGMPSSRNGEPIRTRGCYRMEDAWLATTSPHYFSDEGKRFFARHQRLAKETLYGGDAYNYCLLARGGLDIVIEEGLKPYDILALVPIIEGAGGTVHQWDGKPVELHTSGSVVAKGLDQLSL